MVYWISTFRQISVAKEKVLKMERQGESVKHEYEREISIEILKGENYLTLIKLSKYLL